MTDILTPKERSRLMASVRSKDTKPEMIVRSLVHRLGYRYRLHRKGLPGKPDLVFPGRKAVIFVHGCFWHQHPGCKAATIPKTNTEFWKEKLQLNVQRDQHAINELEHAGWNVWVIWECETGNTEALTARVNEYLSKD
ncbi:MAG: DNA mismatch endonuclease Vsr [Candidatus Thiodiazotropha taylori]|nr:DNA mismatch endonuclease Vsr [Candidatus Thiodiazotropha taylori]